MKGYPIYIHIPTLGAFGMSEYNANLPQGSMQTSLLMTTPEIKVSWVDSFTSLSFEGFPYFIV